MHNTNIKEAGKCLWSKASVFQHLNLSLQMICGVCEVRSWGRKRYSILENTAKQIREYIFPSSALTMQTKTYWLPLLSVPPPAHSSIPAALTSSYGGVTEAAIL